METERTEEVTRPAGGLTPMKVAAVALQEHARQAPVHIVIVLLKLVGGITGAKVRPPSAQHRIQQYFVNKSPAELRSHFEIAATIASDRQNMWLVTMSPKRKQIKEGLATLELWLDRSTVMLTSMRMTFPNGDTTLMAFEDVKVNPTIDPALFQVP